jgi:Tol biopolymer transport system component
MPRLSPDGNKVAVSHAEPQSANADIWLIDFQRGVPTRFTFDAASDIFPIWSPDGNQITFGSARGNGPSIFRKATNRGSDEESLLTGENGKGQASYDWSPDGRYILYMSLGNRGGTDLWTLDLKERKAAPFLATPFNESQPQFSPIDGRWVAYTSDESGHHEVYVRSFTGPARFQVSSGGGGQPRWRRDGKELFYLTPEGKMMAIAVRASVDSFEYESPKALFEARALAGASGSGPQGYSYDVTRDGQRFLAIEHGDTEEPLSLVTNWQARLKK